MYLYARENILVLAAAVLCVSNGFALTATVTSVNETQAVLQEQGFSGSCTILVSASQSLTPLHPDVNGAEYSGANTDTGRADTIQSADGSTRIVTIGHMTDDRALAAFTTYYFQVSGCGGTVMGSLTTANLSTGTTRTEQSPFNSSKWGNLGLPAFNWTAKQTYVDPMTGVTLIPMATSIQTWRTGCNATCPSSSRTFTDWAGGNGWTNPSGALLGPTTNAVINNTNPMDLYADLSSAPDPLPYDWHRVLEDIGIAVWGGANGSNAADRVIDLCIFLNPTAGCASNTIQVTLPLGSVAHVTSGSSDADGVFPAAFPASPFFGWTHSISPLIHMENHETFGTVTVSGNTLAIGNINPSQHFSSAISSGQRIFVEGSSCTNSLCTASAAPSGPNAVSLVETPGVGSAPFRAYGWGIRVWKDTVNGTASIGLQYKLAGSNLPIGVQPGGDKCSAVQVTSGDGKNGYLCSLTSMIAGFGYLAFIATDGTTRILSSRSGFSFDDLQGNVFYAGGTNASGGWTVNKYTYTGDYTMELNYNYTCSSSGACPSYNDLVAGPVDLMPHALNADLDQQIEANQGGSLPAYKSAIYGPWTQTNGSVGYYGSSGHFAFFCNVYSGQGQPNAGGPGWCASVDMSQSPAKVVRLIHTLDGTGAPNARFGSLHSAQQVDSNANTLFLSLDDLNANNPGTLHGGPYQAPVLSLLMADGTWNTNTCLDWPPGGGSICANQSYNRACPANSSPYIECVTFRVPQNGVCNIAPSAIEKATWPCAWNATFSQYPLMQAGDNATDLAANGGFDSEHFRILSITPDSGNTSRVVAARNSVYDYCSFSPWQGQSDPLSAQFGGQLQHANGWTLTMMPGSLNTCGVGVLLQDQVSGSVQELGHSFSGHFGIGRGAAGLNFVTTSATIYNTPFSSLGQIPPVFNATADPTFHGIAAQIGGQLQSYTDDSQLNAGPPGYPWAIDMNPFVACGGEGLGCGPLRTTTSMGGNVYKVQVLGSAAPSNATYKVQPMIGWAGRYQLKEVSGPGSSVDSTPYSMCFVLIAGECHAGSNANEVYVNVPVMYDPGYCSASLSWVNVPCIFFGDNAPGGGIRQFRISQGDSNGAYSRFISNGWSSMGRHYAYSHSTVYQTGNLAMLMGTNSMDGFSTTGFMISLPPWAVSQQPRNDFLNPIIQIPRGPMYAEIQFGYSRYIGPNNSPANGLFCTPRADGCNTSSATLFNFESEPITPRVCIASCLVTIPVVGPNVVYYRFRRSTDGVTWTASDIQVVAIP
jgi:hypothetical protein